MSITSYAQNFEDVMLWRALSHVERGFYIDIGAQDPIIDSVSLAFHERGWRGIHVEPLRQYAELLRQQRPGDVVIQAAVGNDPGVLRFFEVAGEGISTADVGIAELHRERGFDVQETAVSCVSLSSIFDAAAGRQIQWLKIDVEGFEEQVLSSWGSSAARPWIVVVESTLPLSRIETHDRWEAILIAYDYSQIYFDGLNRYYISAMHPELKNAFLLPPNIFDEFALNGTANAPFHKLINARCQERVSEAFAQSDLQRLSKDSEIERLTLGITSLEQRHAELEELGRQRERALSQQLQAGQEEFGKLYKVWANREQILLEQASHARDKVESTLNTLVQREQELGRQLLVVEQQSRQQHVEQARLHGEHEREMQRQYAEQSSQFKQELENRRRTVAQNDEKLRVLEQNRARLEIEHAKQVDRNREALENLLRGEVEREREITLLLSATQQEAYKEMKEQTRSHEEQMHELHREHADRERTLAQKLQAMELELREREQAQVIIQREFDEQLQAERTTGRARQAAFNNVQIEITSIRNSLSWRLTAPFRAIKSRLRRAAPSTSGHSTEAADCAGVLDVPNPLTTACVDPSVFDGPPAGVLRMTDDPPQTTLDPRSPAPNVDTLLQYQDDEFVECAYCTLLKRQPDPTGFGYYIRRLRSGVPKMQILAEIYASQEARATDTHLPGLRKAIRRQRLSQLPVAGALLGFFIDIDGHSTLEKRLRVVEQQVFVLSGHSKIHIAQMKQVIERLKQISESEQPDGVSSNTGSLPASSTSTPNSEPRVYFSDAGNVVHAPPLCQLSPGVSRTFFDLKATIGMKLRG
jgi:FkbM family methyltransferase